MPAHSRRRRYGSECYKEILLAESEARTESRACVVYVLVGELINRVISEVKKQKNAGSQISNREAMKCPSPIPTKAAMLRAETDPGEKDGYMMIFVW